MSHRAQGDLAIEIKGLRKSYGSVEAVRGIDLQVATGEVFALLGPNGAGKTTTVEIMEGHRTRSDGEVSVLGHDPETKDPDLRRRVGIVLQETGVEPYLTVAEAVELYRGYYPHPRDVDEVVEIVGLTEQRDKRVQKLSGGQQRRLDVAIGLVGDPELLFLDEPTTGFDPSARRQAWHMITDLKNLGKTIFLTTHYMDEAENLADRVAIIAAGRIIAEGTPASLVGRQTASTTIKFSLPSTAGDLPPDIGRDAAVTDGAVTLLTEEPMKRLHELTGWALERDIDLAGLQVSRPSLEDIYLDLTAKATEVETDE
jgi:ABC-2 type transport system ATP-binding protein